MNTFGMTPGTFHKTRIAPTPSGFLHLGNLYSFVLTAALAKKHRASLLLRIDDMDSVRAKPEFIEDVFESLDYLGISWDRGPKNTSELNNLFSQQKRLPLYDKALQSLADAGKVFACDCSRTDVHSANNEGVYPGTCRHKQIPLDRANVCWRLNTSMAIPLRINLYQAETGTFELPESMRDFIVRKKDGLPSYQVCSLLDDTLFEIDLIVRGEDLWDSSLAQLYLARVLGLASFESATFLHHELLPAPNGEKLSKSAGDTSIKFLRELGKSREQIFQTLGQWVGFEMKNWQDYPMS